MTSFDGFINLIGKESGLSSFSKGSIQVQGQAVALVAICFCTPFVVVIL